MIFFFSQTKFGRKCCLALDKEWRLAGSLSHRCLYLLGEMSCLSRSEFTPLYVISLGGLRPTEARHVCMYLYPVWEGCWVRDKLSFVHAGSLLHDAEKEKSTKRSRSALGHYPCINCFWKRNNHTILQLVKLQTKENLNSFWKQLRNY